MRIMSSPRTIVPVVVAALALAACGGDDDTSDDPADADVANEAESGAPPTAPPSDDAGDGGSDDGAAVATTVVPGGVEVDEVPDDPAEGSDPAADLPNPTATITHGAETYEAAGYAQIFDMESGGYIDLDGDFLICEAVNPAFEGDANIIIRVGDGLEFTFRVNDGDPYVQFGEEYVGDETNDVTFERDGNTISGSATFAEAEPVSYDIDCG